MDISGDGSMWDLNSTQFIKEKMLRSPAFYSIGLHYDTTEYILKVHTKINANEIPQYT